MRIIHTSDWHIGRRLNSAPLVQSHEKFFDAFITDLLPDQKPDLIVVSGDIYDRAIPPTDAVELFEDVLARLQAMNIPLLITSGNHDSRVRLGTNTRFMTGLGLHFRTRLNQVAIPVVMESDDFTLLAYGIPYLEPDIDAGQQEHQWQVEPNHTAVIAEAIRQIKLDIESRRANSSKPIRTLVAAHAFVAGGLSSDSERNTKVGSLQMADAAVFSGIDYVAMGHLHGAQNVTSPEGTVIRYSGSPIPFSFSERDHKKVARLVTMNASGVSEESGPDWEIPQLRKMVQYQDSLAEILSNKYPNSDHWVKVVLTEPEFPLNVMETLRRKFPNIMELDRLTTVRAKSDGEQIALKLNKMTPQDVAFRFVQKITGEDPSERTIEAIDQCCSHVESEMTQVNK